MNDVFGVAALGSVGGWCIVGTKARQTVARRWEVKCGVGVVACVKSVVCWRTRGQGWGRGGRQGGLKGLQGVWGNVVWCGVLECLARIWWGYWRVVLYCLTGMLSKGPELSRCWTWRKAWVTPWLVFQGSDTSLLARVGWGGKIIGLRALKALNWRGYESVSSWDSIVRWRWDRLQDPVSFSLSRLLPLAFFSYYGNQYLSDTE